MAVTTTQEPTPEQEHKPKDAQMQGSFRDRLLKFIEEGPYLTHEEAEELRRMFREAREENFVPDIPA